jgi:hypothetical protein
VQEEIVILEIDITYLACQNAGITIICLFILRFLQSCEGLRNKKAPSKSQGSDDRRLGIIWNSSAIRNQKSEEQVRGPVRAVMEVQALRLSGPDPIFLLRPSLPTLVP